MKITSLSYPRAALIGNPSDGYFGKTIAFTFSNFFAEVTLKPASKLAFIPGEREVVSFENIELFYSNIQQYGYYGGVRLLMASLKKHIEFCKSNNIANQKPTFSLSYQSSIPQQLGFAGSSAIITACLKSLNTYFKIKMPPEVLANLALSVETEELGIAGGLQDRVAQAFEKPVFMDFDKAKMITAGIGQYEVFNAELLPEMYIAYSEKLSEQSEVVHNKLKQRFDNGDLEVHEAMNRFALLTDQFYIGLKERKLQVLNSLINQNFDLRCSIMNISQGNWQLVESARSVGASAKLTGSGGAIIGIYKDKDMLERLKEKFSKMGASLIIPKITG